MCVFFFFNDTATTEIYTLSLHDALPIFDGGAREVRVNLAIQHLQRQRSAVLAHNRMKQDRKSTRLNSSHGYISYAVFCLKKKNNLKQLTPTTCETQDVVNSESLRRTITV